MKLVALLAVVHLILVTTVSHAQDGEPGGSQLKGAFDDAGEGRWLTWYAPPKPDSNFDKGFNLKTVTFCAESLLYNNFDYVGVTVLEPKLRIYFDVGDDDNGELDIFKDGTLTPTINLTQFAMRNASGEVGRRLFWGLDLGMGISSAAGDETAGAALVISGGFGFEQEIGRPSDEGAVGPLIGVEVGYAQGFSADESLGDVDDGAIYVGLTFRMHF